MGESADVNVFIGEIFWVVFLSGGAKKKKKKSKICSVSSSASQLKSYMKCETKIKADFTLKAIMLVLTDTCLQR